MKKSAHTDSGGDAVDTYSSTYFYQSPWRQSLINALNSCDTAIAVLYGGRGEWPIHDIELECGLLRIDVMGRLDVMEMSDVKRIIAGLETFNNDEFYPDNKSRNSEAVDLK